MRKLFWCFVLGLAIFVGACKKEETSKPAKLVVGGILDSIIIGNNQSLLLSSNINANWTINKSIGGTFSANTFTSGTTDGVYIIKAKSIDNTKDSLQFFVIVTKHAKFFNAMKTGGYVMSFRHSDASLGSDQFSSSDPAWWKSCNSSLARQLTNPKGYLQSDSIGIALKRLRLRFDSSFTSEYCRCKQSLTGFALTGVPIREVKEMTYWVYDEINRYGNTMNFYQNLPITNKNYVAVTHAGFSGNVPMFAPMQTLAWGDAAIFKLSSTTAPRWDTTVVSNDFMMIARD
jgi:phosphohistidine phosphatase SixA